MILWALEGRYGTLNGQNMNRHLRLYRGAATSGQWSISDPASGQRVMATQYKYTALSFAERYLILPDNQFRFVCYENIPFEAVRGYWRLYPSFIGYPRDQFEFSLDFADAARGGHQVKMTVLTQRSDGKLAAYPENSMGDEEILRARQQTKKPRTALSASAGARAANVSQKDPLGRGPVNTGSEAAVRKWRKNLSDLWFDCAVSAARVVDALNPGPKTTVMSVGPSNILWLELGFALRGITVDINQPEAYGGANEARLLHGGLKNLKDLLLPEAGPLIDQHLRLKYHDNLENTALERRYDIIILQNVLDRPETADLSRFLAAVIDAVEDGGILLVSTLHDQPLDWYQELFREFPVSLERAEITGTDEKTGEFELADMYKTKTLFALRIRKQSSSALSAGSRLSAQGVPDGPGPVRRSKYKKLIQTDERELLFKAHRRLKILGIWKIGLGQVRPWLNEVEPEEGGDVV
ncbi:MAG: hypothetical protein WCG06_00215, partial [Candidatus Omnitrophota bacterium]